MNIFRIGLPLLLCVLAGGCQDRQGVSTTSGTVAIECDEAVYPVMKLIVEDFMRTYPDADVVMVPTSVQSAIVNFINDSTRMVVTGRPLNPAETGILQEVGTEYREYHIAIDAVAVVTNRANPVREMSLSRLDSILTGNLFRWPPWGGKLYPVQLALGSVHSSTTQIVREQLLAGRPFSRATQYFDSSAEVLEFVQQNENALGLVALSWLQGREEAVTVVALGDPDMPPDPSEPAGRFYKPLQAHVYRHYYPLTTNVYLYNRELLMTVGLGLISYANNIQGQRLVQSSGLVPATIPVRLVETTSKQVTEQ